MINRFVEWALRHRLLIALATAIIGAWGTWEMLHARVDAIPDLSENQVIVFADWPGRSPQEVEDQVTYPLSSGLRGITGAKAVRASSMFGFSFVTIIFDEALDNHSARSRVLERLNYTREGLPEGVAPQLGPDANGLGWVYEYYLKVDPAIAPNGGYDLGELRAIQDWNVRFELNAIPGVADVGSLGGFVRQYQVEVDPNRLRQLGLTLRDLMDAFERGNLSVGGKTIDEGGREFVVRGVGRLQTLTDIENLVVRTGTPGTIRVRDAARVQLGGDFRRGALDVDGHEAVGGVVVMRAGGDCRAILDRIRQRVSQVNASLPHGVSIQPFYDRGQLIDRAIGTLRKTLVEEVLLVALAHVIFLWHFRSILAVTLPLPLSIIGSFILMRWFGVVSNIMSLAGFAIAIGVLVDAGIVMTENVTRSFERAESLADRRLSSAEACAVTLTAARQVARPIFFSMLIILLGFLPVFVLSGDEGRLFHPLALTKTFAMIIATALAMTLIPTLCSVLVRGPFQPENRNRIMRRLLAWYAPALDWALARGRLVITTSAVCLCLSVGLVVGIPNAWNKALKERGWDRTSKALAGVGSEFMPRLNEGSFLFMPVLLPRTSLTEIKRLIAWQDQAFKQIPEVQSAAGKLGRAETPTDPAPVEMIETIIELKPEAQWRAGMTQDRLIAELTDKVAKAPGCVPGFLHPIEGRIFMLKSGIRAQIGLKIFGDDLRALQQKATEAEKILRSVPGAAGVTSTRINTKPYLNIDLDREALARWGVQARDVLDVIESGLGGKTVSTIFDGRRRFPIQVRYQAEDRNDLGRVGDLIVSASSGNQIPLAELAQVKRVDGPSEIHSENGRLRVDVQANVQDRDPGGFAAEAQSQIKARLTLDPGMTVSWTGQYENQLHAEKALRLIVPTVIGLIFILLWRVYHSAKEAAHVILAVPFALTGGFFLQYLLGYRFSVAVWVGYIALFGVAIQTAIVMVIYLEDAVRKSQSERGPEFSLSDLLEAIREGARMRLRPKVMTVATTVAGLLPILWSHEVGSEIMRPLAVPVLGGMISSAIHILIVTPVLFASLQKRSLRQSQRRTTSRQSDYPVEVLPRFDVVG
jgi:Cu(I)/Ag(I) efflux system membrane protein CusA/SilA